jgi:probable addiction module antidote protein
MMLKDFNETFQDELTDLEYAAGLLKTCLDEEGFETFLVALRDIVKAQGGMTALSKATGLGRESLYKTLSPNGNPEFKTIVIILDALGLKIDFAPAVKAAA